MNFIAKSLALFLLSAILVVAFFKFSLIINSPQAFCPLHSFANSCHKIPNYNDYYQTLRDFSRGLPLNASIVFLVTFIIALPLIGSLEGVAIWDNVIIFINKRAPLNLIRARIPFLHWISLHEGGSPAAF